MPRGASATVHADAAQSAVADGHAKADVTLRPPGRELLGFLLGRVGMDDVDAAADRSKAAAFRAGFTGP
jgi:hypothetical protein